MTDQQIYTLIALGLVAILALTWFIHTQWRTLQHTLHQKKEMEERIEKQRSHTIESIHVLSRAIIDNQIELSEGCIRLRVLLDHIAPELVHKPDYQILHELYTELAHMPTHEVRQQTDRRFIRKMDIRRHKLERENEALIVAAAKALLKEPKLALSQRH